VSRKKTSYPLQIKVKELRGEAESMVGKAEKVKIQAFSF